MLPRAKEEEECVWRPKIIAKRSGK